MIHYLFECHNCGFETLISGKEFVDQVIGRGAICSQCEEVTEYDPNNLLETVNHGHQSVNSNKSETKNEDSDRLPTSQEMRIPYYINSNDFEPWLGSILEEFTDAWELTKDPKEDYDFNLNQIKGHQFGWVKFGAWAFNFKLKKHYRLHYKTWREFCEKELHRSASYVDKIIKAVRVVKELIQAGFKVLPKNEGQARYFTQFWGKELIEKWQIIVDAVPAHYITSTLVKEIFGIKEKDGKKWIKVDAEVLEDFETKARERGVNPTKKLEEILEEWEANEDEETTDELDDNDIEDVPIEKLEAWQADLQALIEEKDRADNWFIQLIFWSFTNDRSPPVSGFS
ncbi:MAG: hypothetical protein AB4063_12465 [Crocosphaera sp.]